MRVKEAPDILTCKWIRSKFTTPQHACLLGRCRFYPFCVISSFFFCQFLLRKITWCKSSFIRRHFLIWSDRDAIIAICRQHSIDTVIPGYGFLSENVHFAKMVTDAGMVFAGPSSESITDMGLKHRAREVAAATGVPIVPGTDLISSETEALAQAERLKYPVRTCNLFRVGFHGRYLLIENRSWSKRRGAAAVWASKYVVHRRTSRPP